MNRRGYSLIEILVTVVLLAVAAAGVAAGYVQGIRANRSAKETASLHDGIKLFWLKTSSDLRNALPVGGVKFRGNERRMEFVRLAEVSGTNGPLSSILKVSYSLEKDGDVIRREEVVEKGGSSGLPTERIVMRSVQEMEFEYAYLDHEERPVFEPGWSEEPYFGIPKAVKITLHTHGTPGVFTRIVPIPQGRWGSISISEAGTA